MGGLYERAQSHNFKEPYHLPERWRAAKDKLDLSTPMNFVCTADIIGGNSGSPVVNSKGEVVGLIFDGNLASLVLNFGYSDMVAGAALFNSRAIIESLKECHHASELVAELSK